MAYPPRPYWRGKSAPPLENALVGVPYMQCWLRYSFIQLFIRLFFRLFIRKVFRLFEGLAFLLVFLLRHPPLMSCSRIPISEAGCAGRKMIRN